MKGRRPIAHRCAPLTAGALAQFFAVAVFAMSVLVLVPAPGRAADWPSRPIHLVAPFGPAGAADKFARVLADYLPAALGQPVVVENRSGGGGLVGAGQVARAEPDGYTLLISSLASQAIAPALSANPGFDPVRNFTHIAYLGGRRSAGWSRHRPVCAASPTSSRRRAPASWPATPPRALARSGIWWPKL